MKFQIRMKPEWNASQTVEIGGRPIAAAASPYDVPDSFTWEQLPSQVVVTLSYDFPYSEGGEVALKADRLRLFCGSNTGRVLKIEIEATSPPEAIRAIADATAALHQLIGQYKAASRPLRQSVHLGMLEQALPHMGMFVAERLKELR